MKEKILDKLEWPIDRRRLESIKSDLFFEYQKKYQDNLPEKTRNTKIIFERAIDIFHEFLIEEK